MPITKPFLISSEILSGSIVVPITRLHWELVYSSIITITATKWAP